MSWMDGMNEQIRLFPCQHLGDICLQVRNAVKGYAAPGTDWTAERIQETINMLELRVDNWRGSFRREEEPLDEAWKSVVTATIAEVKQYTWWQQPVEKSA